MDDNKPIEVGFDAPGVDLILKAINALNGLETAMVNLGTGPATSGLKKIQNQVAEMQASMTTGFVEIEARMDRFTEKVKQTSQATTGYAQQRLAASQAALAAERAAAAESERLASQVAAAEASRTQLATGYAAKRLAASQAALAAERAAAAESERLSQNAAAAEAERFRSSTNYAQQRLAASQAALAAERAASSQAAGIAKASADAEAKIQAQRLSNVNAYTSGRLAQTQANLARLREEAAAEEAIAKKAAATEQAIQAERLTHARSYAQQRLAQTQANIAADRAAAAEQASTAERQRLLNTGFLSSSPQSQLRTVKEAQIYGSLGGDISARYGANVAGLAANTVEYKKLEQAALSSAGAVQHHNEAMREGHAFARGLSGALGTLWVTYGSLMPLLAGAAIAGSLRKVFEAGKDVEYQLGFVKALSEKPVDLEKFLGVTSGTVVSVKEAAEGMRALAQNGYDAQKALVALPSVLNLATVGEMSVAQAALSATGVLAAFNMEASQIERVGDIFAKAAATSNTSVQAMTESMKTASTASALFGVSIEETAASIGILAKLNITGTAAGTSFRNILKDLYEPTKKQGDAMARLGITTRDSNDGLKNYVQVLSEIREKTAGMSEGGRLNFLSQISDERGAKTLIATLNNWEEFTTKINEASNAAGFMQKTMVILEDTVEGASKRMANSFQDTFIKAFASASPIIQATMTELGDLAKSEGFLKFLSGAAEGVANLTRFIIDHANAITNLLLVYAGFKGLSYVIASYTALSAAMGTSTVAATLEAVATRAATVAKSAFASTVATTIPMVQGETVVMVEATTATGAFAAANTAVAGSLRLITMALGPIALALGAAVFAYEVFIKRADEADKELLKQSNTLHVINEDLDRQIAKLEERNKLWNPETLTFKESQLGSVDDVLKRLKAGVVEAQTALDSARKNGSMIASTGNAAVDAAATLLELRHYQSTLDARKELLANALKNEAAMREKESKLNADKAVDTFRSEQERLARVLREFENQATAKAYDYKEGKPVGPGRLMATPAQAEIYQQASPLVLAVKNAKTIEDLKTISNSFEELRGKLNAVGQGFGKIDTAAAADAYHAELNKTSAAVAEYTKLVEGDLRRARSAYDAGTMGSIELINKESEAAKNLAKVKFSSAVESAKLAKDEGKSADYERYAGQAKTALAEYDQAVLTQAQKLSDAKVKIEADTTKSLVAELQSRGEFVKAEDVKLEQGLSLALNRTKADIAKLGETGQTGSPLFAALLADADQKEKEASANRNAAQKQEYEARAKLILDQTETIKNGISATLDSLSQKSDQSLGIFDKDAISDTARSLATEAIPAYQQLIEKARELAKESPDIGGKVLSALEKNLAAADKQINKLERSLAGGMFKELARNVATLGDSFKGVSDAVYGVGTALEKLQFLAAAAGSEEAIRTKDRIGAYGDIAAAASQAFDEQTGGYQTLNGVAKVFHAAQLAMNLVEMGQMAIMAVMNQASKGDPYTAWGRMAAMAAAMGALGYAVGGGFSSAAGGKSAEEVQKTQGTGTVFGDSAAKSGSLTKSLEMLEKNSNALLPINRGMLTALQDIRASMSGLANLVVRNVGVMSGSDMGIRTGTLSRTGTGTTALGTVAGTVGGMAVGTNLGMAIGAIGGPIGMAVGAVLGALTGSLVRLWGKTTQNIVDSGIQFNNTLKNLKEGRGFEQYASVDTTKSSWFGLSKSTTNTVVSQGLNPELAQQFGLIFSNLDTVLKSAASSLGSSSAQVESAISNLTISANVSLKGLTGQALTDALNSVVSKALDEIATAAFPAMDQFRQVGEGYAETVIRVANTVNIVNQSLQSLGMAVMENSMASVEAAVNLAKLSGGIDQFQQGISYFAENFLTEAERMAPVQKALTARMTELGYGSVTTMEGFKNLVLGLDVTKAAQAELYIELLKLAPAFKQVTDAVGSVNKVESARLAMEAAKTSYAAALQSVSENMTQLRNRALAANQAELAVKDRISNAYFAAQDAVVTAQEKIIELNRQAADAMTTFAKSVRSFLAGLVGGATNTMDKAGLEKTLFATAGKAKAGDKDAQSTLITLAQSYLEVSKAGSRTSVEFLRDQALVNTLLGDVATSVEKAVIDLAVPPAKDPMVVAQAELLAAQDKLAEYSRLALATNSNMDKSLVVVADSVQSLLTEFIKAHEDNLKAQADLATAEHLTAGMVLPSQSALTDLLASLDTALKANAALVSAQGNLSTEIIAAAQASRVSVDAFVKSQDLTTAEADKVKAALSAAELSTTAYKGLMDLTGLSASELATKLGETKDAAATYIQSLGAGLISDADKQKLAEAIQGSGTSIAQALSSLVLSGTSADTFNSIIASSGISASAILQAFDTTDTGLQGIVKASGGSLTSLKTSAADAGLTIVEFNRLLKLNGLTETSFDGLKALTNGDAGLLASYLKDSADAGDNLATRLSNLDTSADATKLLLDSIQAGKNLGTKFGELDTSADSMKDVLDATQSGANLGLRFSELDVSALAMKQLMDQFKLPVFPGVPTGTDVGPVPPGTPTTTPVVTSPSGNTAAGSGSGSTATGSYEQQLVESWYRNHPNAIKNPPASDISYWANEIIKNGMLSAKAAFTNSVAYLSNTPMLGITAFAQGGAFTNGVVNRPTFFGSNVMGESGSEAIMPLANVGGSLGVRAVGGDNAELEAEVRALHEEVKMLKSAIETGNATNKKILSLLAYVTRDGRAMQTQVYDDGTTV